MVRATKARLMKGINYTELFSVEVVPAKYSDPVYELDDEGKMKEPPVIIKPSEMTAPAVVMEFEIHPLSEADLAEVLEMTDVQSLAKMFELDEDYLKTFTKEEKQNPTKKLIRDGKFTGQIAAAFKRQAILICQRGIVDPEIAAMNLPYGITEPIARRIEEISNMPPKEVEDFLRLQQD